jgi:protein-tyrosine phosphatase
VQYWADKMLDDGLVHIIATDAHDAKRRPPRIQNAIRAAARKVGDEEAANLVQLRPSAILANVAPSTVLVPPGLKRSDKATGRHGKTLWRAIRGFR